MNHQQVTTDLSTALREIDEQICNVCYDGIAARFNRTLQTIGENEHPDKKGMYAEFIAFSFTEQLLESSGRRTHFCPTFMYTTTDGKDGEFPSLTVVDDDLLEYWAQRSGSTSNPALRARYADLVWDLTKPAVGRSPALPFAHAAIDASLESIRRHQFEEEVYAIIRAKRALNLSVSISDKLRTDAAIDVLVALEERIAADQLPGSWGFAFDALVDVRGVKVDDALKQKLIVDLEKRFERLTAMSPPEPSILERAMERLTRLYARRGQPEDEVRILRKYVSAVKAYVEIVSPLMGSSWLDQVHELLVDRGLSEEAAGIALLMRQVEARAVARSQEYSNQISIPAAELDAELASVLNVETEVAYARVADLFVQDRTSVEEQVREWAKQAVFLSKIKISIRDHDGRAVASVGSIDDDLDGRVALQMSQNLRVAAPLLRHTLQKLGERHTFTAESVKNFLAASPAFVPARLPTLQRGLEALWLAEPYVAACVLIPEIEAGLRQILHLVGGSVYKRSRNGGTNLRNLDEILRDPAVASALTEKVTWYLRIVFTDPRGWNLRNVVCHGIALPAAIGEAAGDRILHALLLLGILRVGESSGHGIVENGA